jgi:uncharacterized UBP type Zn finger protein
VVLRSLFFIGNLSNDGSAIVYLIFDRVCAEYQLLAFVSHMGSSTHAGHYVAHIKKDGRWVIFNDNKVAISGQPPKDMAYLYFYQRVD